MGDNLEKSTVSLNTRQELIMAFPCFAMLSPTQSAEFAAKFTELHVQPRELIVKEGELIDCIYIIVEGEAEIVREEKQRKKIIQVPIGVLRSGEGIGVHDTGFYSTTGKRKATVSALSNMHLLRLDLKDLYGFLKSNHLELSMYSASLQMLRMRFIKQSLPFAKLSHERLQWLADHVEDVNIPKGTVIFSQGEQGDKCYLIRSGEVEIVTKDEQDTEKRLAVLKPPVLFGEATLITRSPRNATARVLEDCELLMLDHARLSELIESEDNVANMFMTLMVDRSRPLQNPNVSLHQLTTADGQEVTILKNSGNGNYFKLSQEGHFIWQQLDGKHTLQDITLDLAEQYNVFAPDTVAALISKLTKADFISNMEITDAEKLRKLPFYSRAMAKVKYYAEFRFAFGDSDKWVTRWYQKYIHYLYTRLAQIILAIIASAGFLTFIINTPNVLLFFSYKHVSLLLILGLVPLSLLRVVLHELGHAFTVKAFGREVHYIGVGWYWFGPIAFTDTTDIWLANRKARILVNLAGVYVDVLIAGSAALGAFFIENPYVQGMLWLFALYTYVRGFGMLSPLQDMDGYYVLMDSVEKTRLRQAAVLWLVKIMPKSFGKPGQIKKYWPEMCYWLACVVYIILVSMVTLTLQAFVVSILGMRSNPYISLILPLFVVVLSSLSVIADIRRQEKEDAKL